MSITIKFGSSPEEIHSVGDLGEDIWDIIFTYKEIAEERDFIQPIVDKFKKMSRRQLGIGGWAGRQPQEEYCRENKIKMSYNNSICFHNHLYDMTCAIVFHHFHRKMPSAKSLPAKWKKKGLQWEMVKECWEQEDQNLFLIAMAFTGDVSWRDSVEVVLNDWKEERGIEYTGCPQFIQMGLDRRKEYYNRPEVIAARRER